jgi:hypothetical protein
MIEIDDVFKVINQLNKYLKGYYVLGGSWVLYFYRFKYPNFKYALRTLDIDFVFSLYAKSKKIKFNLQGILEELGFFPEIVGTVTGYSYATFKGESIDIEFIIEEPTGYKSKILKLENLNIDATPLPFVSDLLEDIIYVNVEGIEVPLPSPERFHIHKWIVAQRRQSYVKKQNDLIQGLEILKICNANKIQELTQNLKGKRRKLYQKSKEEIKKLELY